MAAMSDTSSIWRGSVADAPNFDRNLGALLRGEKPERTVLFEFYHNADLMSFVAGDRPGELDFVRDIRAWAMLGYDHANLGARNGFRFQAGDKHRDKTISLNEGAVITDRASFEAYAWPDVATLDWGYLDIAAAALAPGQKLMTSGPGGVLENVISLIGFEHLCELIADDPELVQDVFDKVGSCLLAYYQRVAPHPAVGFIMSNDDWGFKTQTMLSPKQMRRYVFPWHERIVACAHAVGKPAVLHSCGKLEPVMDDVIDGMKYDGKHSYEDGIMRVEEASARWGSRIAILGGIDLDYLCRTPATVVKQRAAALIAASGGRWAVGTGNSVPPWIPREAFLALIEAGVAGRPRQARSAAA
jgi:uroporphyrinogen decarboxylase